MKKSLIALAVLAASGAAMAQSSVNLYGIVDAHFGSVKSGAAGALAQTKLDSGGLNTNRFGFRGTEDLGGGLSATFNLEQGFSVDSGNAGDSAKAFNRVAIVGLTGSFGTVNFGRNYTAYDNLRGATNTIGNFNYSTTGDVFKMTGMAGQAGSPSSNNGDYTNTSDNQIYYATPVFSGFSGAIGYGLGENKSTTKGADSILSLHVKYQNGPLLVGFAHQDQDFDVDGGATGKFGAQSGTVAGVAGKYNLLAGSYNFGPAKLSAGYNTKSTKTTSTFKDKEYYLGVDVPLGATTLYFGYASSTGDVDGVKTTKASGYSIVAKYDLSKRTSIYGGLKDVDGKNALTGAKTAEIRQYTVGVRHTF